MCCNLSWPWIKLLVLTSTVFSLHSRPWEPPYISGDAFRSLADFVLDETSDFHPKHVKQGNIIFVKTDNIEDFFHAKHPYIRHPYVLITHNGDYPVPRGCGRYLKDSKLLAWFGQNIEGFSHPKLRPIPIGIANQYVSGSGDVRILKQRRAQLNEYDRTHLAYLNINTGTNCDIRNRVYQICREKSFCWERGGLPFKDYLIDLAQSKFVISPRGNGLDCHRTWEALYMGAIPIVTHSSLDVIFENLPVLIIDDWASLTEEFLEEQYQKITSGSYDLSPLYMNYWIKEIRNATILKK